MSQNLHDGPQPVGPRQHIATPELGSTSRAQAASHPGQAYSPPPGPQEPQPAPVTSKADRRLIGLGVLVATGIALAAVYALSGDNTPSGVGALPAAATDREGKSFGVAAVDADLKATEQLKAFLAGASDSDAAKGELQAMNAAGLKGLAKTAPSMADDIQSGRRVLYRIYLLDFLAEDGDYVDFSVDGVSLGITALKGAGTSFLMPLVPGVPARMKLMATGDGGGGVTVGFISSVGEARTRVMQIGDFDEWQVIVQ
jgi:hypothetical protein